MNPFPLDIWSVKEYGVERWHQDFFWPVTSPEYQRFRDEIELLYVETINDSPREIGDALWVLFSWASVGLPTLLHALMVVQRLQRANLSFSYHSSTPYYQALIEGQLIERVIGKPLPQLPSSKRKMRAQLRTWLENIKHRGFDIGSYLDSSRQPAYLATNHSKSWLKEFLPFAESHDKALKIVHPALLMPDSITRTERLPKAKQIMEQFIDGFDHIAKKNDVKIERRQLDHLSDHCVLSVHYVADYIQELVHKLDKYESTSILVNAIGHSFKRSLCFAGRRAGFKMVGFTHGNRVGVSNKSYAAYIEPGMVDTFVATSQGSIELHSLSEKKYLQPYGINIEIVANQTGSYAKIREQSRITELPASIKSVMLLEFPMNNYFGSATYGLFWAYQLDLNLRLARLFRQQGLRTIIKKHPDRLRESEGVYNLYYDQLLITSFEEVYDQADAYIFPTIGTTTFGFAVLTNKPIIIFESSLEDVWEPASQLLRKRCRVIPSWVAEDGRLMFDESKLIAALNEPPEEPNDEFIERYMLS